MRRGDVVRCGGAVLALALAVTPARAQSDGTRAALDVAAYYRVLPDLIYSVQSNWEAKLDIYAPRDTAIRAPTLVYFHGGGWMRGSKEASFGLILPYLLNGWTVVNVEYRVGPVAPAPAAVEDARCAVRWVMARADQYGIDRSRVVVSGGSAGGHLALTTGMLPLSAGLDRQCAGTGELAVAAVVNWFGITDVADLLDGPNVRGYAVSWMGSRPDRVAVAQWLSPLSYVRRGLPPVITIHGDADPTVPYQHAVRLHRALDSLGVVNQLVTIPGGGHGGFSREENGRAWAAVEAFLTRAGVAPKAGVRP